MTTESALYGAIRSIVFEKLRSSQLHRPAATDNADGSLNYLPISVLGANELAEDIVNAIRSVVLSPEWDVPDGHNVGHAIIETRCTECGIVASCSCVHSTEDELWAHHRRSFHEGAKA